MPANQPSSPICHRVSHSVFDFFTLGLKHIFSPSSPGKACCASSSSVCMVCVWVHHTMWTTDVFPPQGALVSYRDWQKLNGMCSIHLFQKLKQAEWILKGQFIVILSSSFGSCNLSIYLSVCLAVFFLHRLSPEDKLAFWFPISRLNGPKFPCM